MSALIELSIFPMDKGLSVSPYVARALDIIQASGLDYELNPMGTCIEGDWPDVMAVVNRCMEDLQKDCSRIYMTMKVDYRNDRSGSMVKKVASVKEKLQS